MDIKKALQFIETHATWETKDDIKRIVDELSSHLNNIADLMGDKVNEISRLQGELERYKEAVNNISEYSSMIPLHCKESHVIHFVDQINAWIESLQETPNES